MLTPTFKLEYNQKNITKDVSDYVVSIDYTDYEHGQSDEISITFEDSQGLWNGAWIPSKGDALRLFIGYEGEQLLNCGIFEIDEIEYETPSEELTVKALATGIKKSFRQANSIGYENKTLKQIANEVAKRHNLNLVGEIENIKVERITQNKERDLSFLKRIAELYGYIFKIAENNLVFYKTEKLMSANSAKIIYKSEVTNARFVEKTSHAYKSVSVSYRNPKTGKNVTATAKNEKCVKGDVLKLSTRVENKQQALIMAKAALKKGYYTIEGYFSMAGNPYLVSGLNLETKDFGYFSGKYHITQANHHIDKLLGYSTSIEVKSC